MSTLINSYPIQMSNINDIYRTLFQLLNQTFDLHIDILYKIFGNDITILQDYLSSIKNNTMHHETLLIVIADILKIFRFKSRKITDETTKRKRYLFEEYDIWHENGLKEFNNIIFRLQVDLILKKSLMALLNTINTGPTVINI